MPTNTDQQREPTKHNIGQRSVNDPKNWANAPGA
jgi:hypothetical protein